MRLICAISTLVFAPSLAIHAQEVKGLLTGKNIVAPVRPAKPKPEMSESQFKELYDHFHMSARPQITFRESDAAMEDQYLNHADAEDRTFDLATKYQGDFHLKNMSIYWHSGPAYDIPGFDHLSVVGVQLRHHVHGIAISHRF